ncbi:MAG: ABC transporter substrate-binding protein [Hyphomicrobiales bacterium]|nr:ABC transporter substrate-binding protein [Hyphomicrobiales bacterium]
MRHLHYPLAAALAAALATGAAAQDKPVKGGTLVWGLSAEAGTLDCGGTDTFAVIHTVAPFYSTLLRVNLDKYPEVEGDLAKSWTISQDGLTYSFDIHEGVTFHDGSPLTSEDIKASLDRYRNPPAGVPSFRKASFEDIASIETPSPTKLVITLKAPNPAMLLNLAGPNGCIYSAKKLAEDPKFPITNVMGSGPFKFVKYEKGASIEGVRFDGYFKKDKNGTQLPYLDGFKGVVFSQPAAMINALQGGQIMGEFRTITPAQKKTLQETAGDKLAFYESDWNTGLVLAFNTKKPPFDNVKVRQALSMAIDRFTAGKALSQQSILKSVGGLVRPGAPYGAKPEALKDLPGFNPDIKAAREKAKALLKEAGVENLKFELFNRSTTQPYTPSGVYLIAQWKEIGVEVTHKQVETPAYREGIKTGSFDVALDFLNAVLEDPSLTLNKYLSSSRDSTNGSGFEDKEADALYDAQLRETDPKKREALVRQFENRVITQGAQTPFIWWYRTVALSKQVKGWKMSPSHLYGQDFGEVWLAQAK